MALKLFTSSGDNYKYRIWKIQIAAQYAGVNVDVVDSSSKDFKGLSPIGKTPVLSSPNGPIFESNAILRHLARLRADSGLYGDSYQEAALVDQWIDFSLNELEPVRHIWLLPVQGILQFNGKAYAEARKEVADALAVLNTHLRHNTFLVGTHVTIADIAVASALVEPYRDLFDQNFRKGFEAVNRWFNTIVNQKEALAVLGKVELAKQEKRAPKPAKPEGGDQKQPQQQQQQQKQQQQKQQQQQQKPKQEKPAAKNEEKDDGGDPSDEPPKPKAKNPLDLLPATTMSLDAEKKNLFSVRPYNTDFFKTFWTNFDSNGYSIYFSNYNYNNENRVYFMTCNLIGGFLQRCDDLRRYGLGVMILAGNDEDAPPFEVSGVWIFRGSAVPQEMKDNPDSEYYTFTKLDSGNAEHRKKVETYFFSETVPASKDGTLKVLERRFFK
jgi:elongation factor 1-gamma